MKESDRAISRRNFISGSIASLIGAGVGMGSVPGALNAQSTKDETATSSKATESKPQIKEYRTLGRTGWKVSDISFGNAGMQDPAQLEYAIERGINYVDTARQYYDMEIVIGKIFPQKRDKPALHQRVHGEHEHLQQNEFVPMVAQPQQQPRLLALVVHQRSYGNRRDGQPEALRQSNIAILGGRHAKGL